MDTCDPFQKLQAQLSSNNVLGHIEAFEKAKVFRQAGMVGNSPVEAPRNPTFLTGRPQAARLAAVLGEPPRLTRLPSAPKSARRWPKIELRGSS